MNAYTSVRPEHLNLHGYLFGGQMLFRVDGFAWKSASRDVLRSRIEDFDRSSHPGDGGGPDGSCEDS